LGGPPPFITTTAKPLATSKLTAKGPDPAKVATNVCKKIFVKKLIRVFEMRFKPGDKAQMHWHPSHFVYISEEGSSPPPPDSGRAGIRKCEGWDLHL
jgi:hypothetical protein